MEDRTYLSSVTGVVFEDLSSDGVKQSGERTLAGFPVTLWRAGADGSVGTSDDVYVSKALTDSAGLYQFSVTTVDQYRVRFGGSVGAWKFSPPSVASNQTASDVDAEGFSARFTAGTGESDITVDAGISHNGNAASRARWLKYAYNFERSAIDYSVNFFGDGEKWLKGDWHGKGQWYFVTPAGDLYAWNPAVRDAVGEYVASVGTAIYANPTALHSTLGEVGTNGSSPRQLAWDLDSQLSLQASSTWNETYGGLGVRWISGDRNQYGTTWYFITSDGSFHAWDGRQNKATGVELAQLSAAEFQDPILVTNAVRPVAGDTAQLIREAFGIRRNISRPAKVTSGTAVWFEGSRNQFGNTTYFLNQNGHLFAWDGSSTTSGRRVAVLPALTFAFPSVLANAEYHVDQSSVAAAAWDLNRQYSLKSKGWYSQNWAGMNEKWVEGSTVLYGKKTYFIILPSGEVRRVNSWKTNPRSVDSTYLTTLSPVYYQFPELLHNAVREVAFASDGGTGTADKVSPVVSLDGATTTILSNGNVTITGQVTDNASGVDTLLAQVDLGDAVAVSFGTDGRFTFTTSASVTGSSDGSHVIRLRATDKAGNVSALTTLNWTLDTTAPVVTSSADGTLRDQIQSITLDFSEPVVPAADLVGSYSLVVASGTNSGQSVPISSVNRVSNTQVQLNLAAPLNNLSYRLTIGNAVTDIAGNLASQQIFEFGIAEPTHIEELSPSAGEEMVSLTRETIVRFDTEIDPATITSQSFYLIANSQRVPGHIRVSSTNRFATFFYDDPLPASTAVRVVVDGNLIIGQDGLPVDADGDSEPGGVMNADFRTLPITLIANTRIFGYVYDSYNRNPDGSNIPVVGATISLDARPDIKAVTNALGFFELGIQDTDNNGVPDGLPAPELFVHIDGSTATNAPAGAAYATLGKPFHTIPGQRTQLEMAGGPDVDPNTPGEQFHIYLPPMSMGDVVTLNPTADTIVGFGPDAQDQIRRMMSERYPTDPVKAAQQAQLIIDTMQVTYPAGSAQNEDGTPATRATIVPVDPSRLPAPLPPGVDPGLVISIQAGTNVGFNLAGGSTNFEVPAPVVFPNLEGLPIGDSVAIVSFDHDRGEWRAVGSGAVVADGRSIRSDFGTGVLAPGWHYIDRLVDVIGKAFDPKACDEIGGAAEKALRDTAAEVLNGLSLAASLIDSVPWGVFDGPFLPGPLNVGDAMLNVASCKLSVSADSAAGNSELSPETQISCAAAYPAFWLDLLGQGELATPYDWIGLSASAWSTLKGAKSMAESIGRLALLPVQCIGGIAKEKLNSLAEKLGGVFDEISDDLDAIEKITDATEEFGKKIKQFRDQLIDNIPPLELAPFADSYNSAYGYLAARITAGSRSAGRVSLTKEMISGLLEDQASVLRSLRADFQDILCQLAGPGQLYYSIGRAGGGGASFGGLTASDGTWHARLSANSSFSVSYFSPRSMLSWTESFQTGAGGSRIALPVRCVVESDGTDTDSDGINDTGELIIGTNVLLKDTDLDGVSDLAEIQQGLDPLGGRSFPTGLVASLGLPGEARSVELSQTVGTGGRLTGFAATGSHGLAVFDSSNFQNPTILGQIDLNGTATDVAVDSLSSIAIVATGESGLQFVDVTDSLMPKLSRTVSINATQVEMLSGLAYASDGSRLTSYDPVSGDLVTSYLVPDATAIVGMTHDGPFLYVMDANRFFACH